MLSYGDRHKHLVGGLDMSPKYNEHTQYLLSPVSLKYFPCEGIPTMFKSLEFETSVPPRT